MVNQKIQIMKEIRIFVASSKELLPERNHLAYLALAMEDEFERRGLRIRLAKWEYVDSSMTKERTEDRYLDEMMKCDAVMVLFKNVLGMYTEEEMKKALAAERGGYTRLKAHRLLFSEAPDAQPKPDLTAFRSSLATDDYGTFGDFEGLGREFLALVERCSAMPLLNANSEDGMRVITAFLAADEELASERDAFADMVVNLNELLAKRNLRVRLRFYEPSQAADIVGSCEMGLVLYRSTFRTFGRDEMRDAYRRTCQGENPRRLYVYFRNDEGLELEQDFRVFREEFVKEFEHFVCQFGDADSLKLGFIVSLERYAGEGVETYSTVESPSPVFVGREEELKRLHALLMQVSGEYPCGRIPVITGAGGTGKSELVRQYVSQLRVEFPGGVFQIDMEHVSSVDEAFLRLLDQSPAHNGKSVAAVLGFGDDKRQDDGGDVEGRKAPTGANVRDALLRRSRTSGPILLFLDNVEYCDEIFGSGARVFFPAGFSELVKIGVVATARVFDAVPEDGSVVPFPLGDLSPEDALELLLGQYPAANDEERQAAKDVARLLGHRALFLRRVPAIIDTKSFGRTGSVRHSYRSLAKALEEDSIAAISGTGQVDELHLPGKLWKLTMESLSECLLGDAAVRLVQLAAHFSTEGFPRHVLRRLWDTEVFPKFKDDDMEADEAFGFVLDMCRTYNVFQSTDSVRIHRLDREAILHELGDADAEAVDAIGRSLAGYVGASPELWLSLAELTPDIIHWIPEDIFFSIHSFGYSRSSLLRTQIEKHPQFADRCPWEELEGVDLAKLLGKYPQFVDRCPGDMLEDRLDIKDWVDLLVAQPQFAERCPWDGFDGENWSNLLGTQPQFADRCPWEKLDGWNWTGLLVGQPQFADKCSWEKLNSGNWACLFGKQPQFANRYPKKLPGWMLKKQLYNWQRQGNYAVEKFHYRDEMHKICVLPQTLDFWEGLDELEGGDWARLLEMQPQFADRCPWEKLEGGDWAHLLEMQPQFADRCPWEKLDSENWAHLLDCQPQFAPICPWEKLEGRDWAYLLGGGNLQFADKCPWEKLNGENWAFLLDCQPQFAIICPWEKLDGKFWAELMGRQARFADRCPWEKLDDKDWVHLLTQQIVTLFPLPTQYEDKCPWEKLDGGDWASLLSYRPEFADKCQWEKLEEEDWTSLLSAQPEFADKCPDHFNANDDCISQTMYELEDMDDNWKDVLWRQGHARKCPWRELNELSSCTWVSLLMEEPLFADMCPWEKLEDEDWAELLGKQPQFAGRCPWETLEGWSWAKILGRQPQFADRCPWEILDGYDWVELLGKQPQFADRCPWGILDGHNWVELLGKQPQFADRCPWETLALSGEDWLSLLEKSPFLATRCSWEKLNSKNWVALLRKQPQFADNCPWEKLNFIDWLELLQVQPQFVDKCQLAPVLAVWETLINHKEQ